jgi:hypothetical protein
MYWLKNGSSGGQEGVEDDRGHSRMDVAKSVEAWLTHWTRNRKEKMALKDPIPLTKSLK